MSEAARHPVPPPAQTPNSWRDAQPTAGGAVCFSEGGERPLEAVRTTAAIFQRTGRSAASVEQSADARLATLHKSWNNMEKNISLPH